MTEIALGNGTVAILGVEQGDRKGICLRPINTPHEVGEPLPEHLGEWELGEGDVVIWLDSEVGATVLQDQVNISLLRFRGFSVANAELSEDLDKRIVETERNEP